MAPRLLVVGCGAIGGVVAAHLLEQGLDTTALTTNPLIADAINTNGFVVRGEGALGAVRGAALRALPKNGAPFDYVLLATQPTDVEKAAREAAPWLAPDGVMVCFQNGLCEERVGALIGPERVLGAVVAWGASMIEPGVYDRTSAGGFALGRPSGEVDAKVEELGRLLEAVGPVHVTDNLLGSRWSKLAINCAISSLGTVGGDRLGALLRHRFVRRLALEIMTETRDVARALGVRLEKVAGTLDLDWIALTPADRAASGSASLIAKHTLLLAVGARYRRLRSSMLAAIERGRPPAVDFLNGEVVSRGRALGIPTPVSALVQERVHTIAGGKLRPSVDSLRALYADTRALVGPGAEEPPSTQAPSAPEPPAELGGETNAAQTSEPSP